MKSGNVDSLRKLVDEIVLPATDFTMMTRMTVGPKWRTATAEQKKALESGFETLLLRVYAGGLTAVKDQKCELRPTRVKKAQPEMVIRTLLKSSGAEPIALDYRIYRAKDDTWKIDLAGVSGGDSSLLSVLLSGRRIAPDLQILNLSPALAQLAQLYGVADLLGLPKSASETEVN